MTYLELRQWLENNGYYDYDESITPRIIVLKNNHDETFYGMPGIDKYFINGIKVDVDKKHISLSTSEIEEFHFDLPPSFLITKKADVNDFTLKIDACDVEFGDIGHSEGRFYLMVCDD